MLTTMLAVLMQVGTAAPSPDTLALARRLANAGTLASLLPLMATKETEEMVAAHPELAEPDRVALRAEATAQAAVLRERVLAAEAQAFAARLSADDLGVLVAAAESEAGRRLRAAMPQVILATMGSLEGIDFKGQTLKAYCAKTGKACPAPPGR